MRPTKPRPPGPTQTIYLRRVRLGLTLSAAAAAIGFSKAYLSAIELGLRRARPQTLQLIEQAYNEVESARSVT